MKGKFVHFYYEPVKKIIGWQIRETVNQQDMKAWKLCKPAVNGSWPTSIKKLLQQFDGRLKNMTYESVPIQKYREINQLSEYKNQTFYFIELVDQPDELRKGVGNEKLQEMTVA